MRNRAVDSSIAWTGTTRFAPGDDHLGGAGGVGINVAAGKASVAGALPTADVVCDGAAVVVDAATGVRGTVKVRNRLAVPLGVACGAVGPRNPFDVV